MTSRTPASPQALLVLGMHRSGTSAVTRVLNLLGASLGRDLLPPKEDNERGFWENASFVNLNDSLLSAFGLSWHDLAPLPAGWRDSVVTQAFASGLGKELKEQFGTAQLTVVKDPRLCLLASTWLETLRDAHYRPACLIVVRHPDEVAASLARRDGFSLAKSRLLWLQHMLEAERASRGWPRVFVAYESLLADWRREVARWGRTLALTWPACDAATKSEIDRFLDPELRHHRGPAVTGSDGGGLLEEFHAALLRASGDSAVDSAQLEMLGERIDAALALSAQALRELESALARERAAHSVEVGLARSAISDKEAELAAARRNIDSMSRDIENARQGFAAKDIELAGAREVITGKDAELAAAREVIAGKDSELAGAREVIAGKDSELAGAREVIAGKDSELAGAREVIAGKDTELASAREVIAGKDAELAQARQVIAGKDAELSAARNIVGDKDDELERARMAIDAKDGELEAARQLMLAKDMELAAVRASLEEALAPVGLSMRGLRNGMRKLIEHTRKRRQGTPLAETLPADPVTALSPATSADGGIGVRVCEAGTAHAGAEAGAASARVASALALHWFVETPLDEAVIGGGELDVMGWCLSSGVERLAVRVRVGDAVKDAELGLSRPDVEAALPGLAHSATCGFRARLPVAPGDHEVEVEALHAGTWQTLTLRRVQVRLAELRLSIDTPVGLRATAGSVRVSGWCVHPQRRVVDLRLVLDGKSTPCSFGLARADVAEAMAGLPGADLAGFEASLQLAPGRWPIHFLAVLDDGSELRLDIADSLLVQSLPWPTRLRRNLGGAWGFLRYGMSQGRNWIRENRRLPRPTELPGMVRFAFARYRERIRRETGPGLPPGFSLPVPRDPYQVWIEVNRFTPLARRMLQQRLDAATALPSLAVVMPVYNPPLDLLQAAVGSVRDQVYADWELCIADDASTDAAIQDWLQQLAASEPRVRLTRRGENGNISRATNDAASLASADWLVFLDQDDLLTPDALAEIALCAGVRAHADIIYSDDDKIDAEGQRFAPQFKPDWSPELLLAYMYFSHVFAVRRELFARVGGMRIGFEGSQDYDFALRATEQARGVAHIPQVLYHWRVLPGSTAASGAAKPASFEAGRRAVDEALQRRGVAGRAVQPDWALKAGCGIFAAEFPDDGPRVSILIPTKNGLSLLRRCVDSLRRTSYRNYDVLIIDNNSDDPATLDYMAQLPHRVERIPNPAGRFNYAWINNRAAERATGDYVLFLNNDTEVVEPRWLSQMVGYAQFAGVGAVGARLLYPDGRIQHAGIVHGYYRGLAGPAFKLLPAWNNGYLSYARVSRNYSAATAACLLTPRDKFLELGGFDEREFEVAYNDVDYCYRLADRGLRTVYCPEAELLHYEGHTRGFVDRPQEIATFRRKYAQRCDPYYSPHLSLDDESFSVQPRRFDGGNAGPVRALMCAFNLNWEGAPYSQLELTLGLKQRGLIDPVVYAPSDGPLRAKYEEAGIPVHVAAHPLNAVFDAAAYDAAIARFAGFIADLNVDVVYGNTLQTFYAIEAARQLGLPSLWNPRESEPWQTYFNFLAAPLAARALQCFAHPYRVIFVAEATRRVWAPLDSTRNFTVIHNGLNRERLDQEAARYPRAEARAALGLTPGDVALLLPGTVCERKGQQELVQALSALEPGLWPRLRCYIVGDRPSSYSVQLHQQIAALPEALRERVHVVPETHEIVRYYQAADVFVCTSRLESFPRVVLEAMAFGLPIVSTRVFGIAEQVGEGVNALLYDPGDVPALAQRLARIVENDDLRRQLAENSPHMLATLGDYDEMVGRYGRLFQEAAASSTSKEEARGIHL